MDGLRELQRFRELEGLRAPRLGRGSWVAPPLLGPGTKSSRCPRGGPQETAEEEDAERGRAACRGCRGPAGESPRPRVEDCSYVTRDDWRVVSVGEVIDPCGTWGVGGAPRVGESPEDEFVLSDSYRVSIPRRLATQVHDGFRLGQRREEGESLALVDHLQGSRRRGGGGRGSAHLNWFHSPCFGSRNKEPQEAGCWEEASEAIRVAHAAMHHQWRMEAPPPAPTRPRKWLPTAGWHLHHDLDD